MPRIPEVPLLLELLLLLRLENRVLMDDESYAEIVIKIPPFLKFSTSVYTLVL
jgi:hypothetical protein